MIGRFFDSGCARAQNGIDAIWRPERSAARSKDPLNTQPTNIKPEQEAL